MENRHSSNPRGRGEPSGMAGLTRWDRVLSVGSNADRVSMLVPTARDQIAEQCFHLAPPLDTPQCQSRKSPTTNDGADPLARHCRRLVPAPHPETRLPKDSPARFDIFSRPRWPTLCSSQHRIRVATPRPRLIASYGTGAIRMRCEIGRWCGRPRIACPSTNDCCVCPYASTRRSDRMAT